MKRRKLLAMLIFVELILVTIHAYSNDYSFRKTTWGMSKQQVIASETIQPAQKSSEMLGYKTRLMGNNVILFYAFVDDKLVRSVYMLSETHSNENDFINDYEEYKEALTKKYGQPDRDETLWRNDLYKDDPSHWGLAVSMGHLTYYSEWATPETEVLIVLNGDNFEIVCAIQYISKKYKHLEEKQEEKKAMDNL